jgi:hypothetical protein
MEEIPWDAPWILFNFWFVTQNKKSNVTQIRPDGQYVSINKLCIMIAYPCLRRKTEQVSRNLLFKQHFRMLNKTDRSFKITVC